MNKKGDVSGDPKKLVLSPTFLGGSILGVRMNSGTSLFWCAFGGGFAPFKKKVRKGAMEN